MPNAFIFHGTGGHSEENWFPWMKKELIKLGYDVIIPNFPEPDNPTPDNWYPVIDELKEKVDSDSIVIGHSLGGAIALRFLERIKTPVKITAIVSATLGIPPIKYIEGDSPFLEGGFDWDRIKSHSKNFLVFHSDNDPYV
ncbi:alpha/beta fold hydrolase, partial [Patescibacteria group bacterium]|nr:alpha/beta fold hydrolase [Patescibacteria group bacterium]